MRKFIGLLAITLFVTACSDKKEVVSLSSEETSVTKSENTPVSSIVISGDDRMKYDVTEFTVKAGQEISIELKNIGEMPKDAMGHNLVILKPSTDVENFAKTSQSEAANDYIPESLKNEIIANTKLLGPGESDMIKVTFNEVGDYNFICTFPNHYLFMKGIIKVVE